MPQSDEQPSDLPAKPRGTQYGLLATAVVLTVAGGFTYRALRAYEIKEGGANYTLGYPSKPTGWRDMPHSPQTLFLYQDPKTKVLLGGSVSQLVLDMNPTPELQTDAMAENLVELTRQNMPGWTGKVLGTVSGNGMYFRLVRRAEKDHVIYTAFSVRGNTTVLITFSARMEHTVDVDNETDRFRQFLSRMTLTRADLSNL